MSRIRAAMRAARISRMDGYASRSEAAVVEALLSEFEIVEEHVCDPALMLYITR